MANEPHRLIALPNRTYQAVVRSEIKKIAASVGFSSKRMAEFEIVISEITSNIVKHTTKGAEILVKIIAGQNPGIEIISIDAGPGMESVSNMMEDGISSTNTLGNGLGAIKRLSDEFDVFSMKDWGTVLLSRVFGKKPEPGKKNIETGIIMLAKEGEVLCGDDYHYTIKGNSIRMAVCDGLGHGKDAHQAAEQCLKIFADNSLLPPSEQIKVVHAGAKRTRGAVMYITQIDFSNKQVTYCGVGNITSKIITASKAKYCTSYNGIVGHSIPNTINNHSVQCNKNDLFVIHSDGLSSRWDLQKFPGILKHDRSIIAAVLYKDFCRKTDDVTVAVISQANRKS